MRKFILLFLLVISSLVFLSENYLSNKVKNLTNLFLECNDLVAYDDQCSNYIKSSYEVEGYKKSYELDVDKIYSYKENKHDLENNINYNGDLVSRESALLNYSMYKKAMEIKDFSKNKLARVKIFLPI